MADNRRVGTINSLIGIFNGKEIQVLKKSFELVNRYQEKQFSLEKNGGAAKTNAQAVAIVRRFSKEYPEYLANPHMYFRIVFNSECEHLPVTKRLGLTLQSGDPVEIRGVMKPLIDLQAAARFFQIVFQVLKKPGGIFISATYEVSVEGPLGGTGTTYSYGDVIAVSRNKIDSCNMLDWMKGHNEKWRSEIAEAGVDNAYKLPGQ